MASIIDDLKRLYTQIEGGPQAQGSVLYEEPSPFASMVREQFSNQNYQGSQPLQDTFIRELEENAARTAPTRGQQRDIAAEYFTGTPGSVAQARQNLTNTTQKQKDIENLAASLAPATPFPTPAPLTMKPIPAGVTRTPAEDVAAKTTAAINAGGINGTNMGNADRNAALAQTLMGGDMQAFMQNLLSQQNPTPPKGDFVSNLLRMFAQPEFQQAGFAGQGFGPTVLGATKALRAMETQDAEMMKAQMEAQVKLAEAQESSFPKPSAEVSKIYDTIDASQRRVNKVNEIKSILSDQISTGGFGTGLTGVNKLASLFGFSISPSGQQNVNNAVAELKQLMVQARVFGRETSAKEQEIVDRLLPNASAFNNPETILKAIDRELKRAEQDAANASLKLDLYGLPKRSELVGNNQIGVKLRQPGQ